MSCTSSATDPVSGPESIMPFLATGGSVWLGVLWGLSGKEHPERILLGLLWRVIWRENMKLHESTLKRNDMTKHEKHKGSHKKNSEKAVRPSPSPEAVRKM